MTVKRIGDLELDQNLAFQRREWRVERVGWALIALVILLAALGLFGTGPVSSATSGGGETGLTVRYQRFVRHQGQTALTIEVDARHAVNGEVTVWIDARYLQALEVASITPEPVATSAGDERVSWVFAVEEGATRITIGVDGEPREMGLLHGALGAGDVTVRFRQLAYP